MGIATSRITNGWPSSSTNAALMLFFIPISSVSATARNESARRAPAIVDRRSFTDAFVGDPAKFRLLPWCSA